MGTTSGIVYIAVGPSFVEEARISARSVRQQLGDIPITLYTNRSVSDPVFDDVRKMQNPEFTVADSILTEDMFPYDRNLFLDTDTYVCGDLSEVFNVLEEYDLAICNAPGRKDVPDVPNCIKEYNTGVIAYRKHDSVKQFFKDWREKYENQVNTTGHITNQATFTKCLYKSKLDHVVLPQEYNVKTRRGYANGEVKIVHGRHPAGLSAVAKSLNRSTEPRSFIMSSSLIGEPVRIFDRESRLYRIQRFPLKTRRKLHRLAAKLYDGGVSASTAAIRRFLRRRIH